MSMKLNLQLLSASLSRAAPEETVPPAGCNRYLVEKVFRPVSRGEPVLLKDIDYSQFDQEDIDSLENYNCTIDQAARTLANMIGAIAETEPAARHTRRYC